MRVGRLQVTDLRNLQQVCLEPDPQLTVLCGQNGQGKTNLLEAIWLLTGGKSFRAAKDAELIRHGQPFAVLEANLHAGGRAQTMRLTVGAKGSQRPGRTVKLNGVDRGRASAIAGVFTAVVFEPDHLRLVKDGPAQRRRFLDAALCQCRPAHIEHLRRYARALAQKNALLKAYEITPGADLLLDTFNDALAREGGAIMARRAAFVAALAPLAAANYTDISQGREALTLRYQPCVEGVEKDAPPEVWTAALADKLLHRREAELRAGFCISGPHREDVEILLDGQPGRIYGSQGQQRSAVLAMKLAEGDVLGMLLEEKPVMLLDDVLSELDDARQAYLLTRIHDKQTFVTTCDSSAFGKTDGEIVMVENGKIQ